MLDQTAHQTSAMALEETACIEGDRNDIGILLQRKPHAEMDMLTVWVASSTLLRSLVRVHARHNPNQLIEREATFGERLADTVANFSGTLAFIIAFVIILSVYVTINAALKRSAWDPYPSITLILPKQSVSFDARRHPGAGDHDEPAESERKVWRTG